MEDSEEPWHSHLLTRRHITHNRSKSSRTGGKGSGQIFDPRSAYGKYTISCPALAKTILKSRPGLITSDIDVDGGPLSAGILSPTGDFVPSPVGTAPGESALGRKKSRKGSGRRGSKDPQVSKPTPEATLEIHSTIPGDGNEGSLQCSFNFSDVIHGTAILAGSRRLLSRVIADLEGEGDSEGEGEEESVASTAGYDDSEEEEIIDEIEAADERERKKIAAFEKNSFRAPKFWMKWKGWVNSEAMAVGSADASDGAELQRSKSGRLVEVNTGYIVFSGNGCERFNATFTCQALGWKGVKISGSKVVGKASARALGWMDVDDGGGRR